MNTNRMRSRQFSKEVLALVVGLTAVSLYATTWSVDQVTGDDAAAAADSTGETPFLHIQAAINKAGSGDTIVVGDGVYGSEDEGVQTTSLGGKDIRSTLAIMSKYLTLRSRNGAAHTIIEGRLDVGTVQKPGVGPNAVRCLFAFKPTGLIAVEGFTFRSGATAVDSTSYDGRGGAVLSYETSGAGDAEELVLINCVITNCFSHTMGAVCESTLVGCRVENCRSLVGASGQYGGKSCFTVYANNSASNDYEAASIKTYPTSQDVGLFCCTFWGNRSNTDARGTSAAKMTTVSNCYLRATLQTYASVENSVVDTAGTALNAPTAGDYRPVAGGIADVAAVGELPDILPEGYSWDKIKDAAGNVIIPSALRVGAVQEVAGKVTIAASEGGLDVEGANIGTPKTLGPGEKIVIKPSGVASRPCAGVTVNGETVFFDDLDDGTLVVTYDDLKSAGADGITIEAYYTNIFYLSPQGDDDASGFTAKTAKKNFAAIFTVTKENDVVRLADGDYNYGDVMVSGKFRARVVVPKNVTIEGSGAGKSFIHGVSAMGTEDGCGADAAICVYLGATGAKVRHCTLTGGRAATDSSTGNIYGAGVSSANRANTSIEFCVITNCVATRGGGANGVRLVNCLVTGCRGTERASGTFYCEHYNTAVIGNDSINEAVMNPYVLNNSTVGGNSVTGLRLQVYAGQANLEMKNSLVVGKIDSAPSLEFGELTNNYVVTLGTGAIAGHSNSFLLKTAEELQIDAATGRPLVGKNACIGQGDYSKYDRVFCGDIDLYGLPRVINGTLDVGALDADYRPIYLRDIGTKNGQILEFTSGILHDADNGRVTLGDGDRLVLSWWHKMSGNCELVFEIPEGGEALVELNGEVVEPVGGHYSFAVSADNSDVLSVSYAGPGKASFKVKDPSPGLILLFR